MFPDSLLILNGRVGGWVNEGGPGRGTHYKKVTAYAPPFRPPFFRSQENLYSFDPYIWAKMRKMYFDPYFSSNFGKMYSFDPPPPPPPPPFWPFVAFRVNRRCWATLSETRPSSPPGGRQRNEVCFRYVHAKGVVIYAAHNSELICFFIIPGPFNMAVIY